MAPVKLSSRVPWPPTRASNQSATYKAPGTDREVRFPPKKREIELHHDGRADQAAVAAVWPAPDRFTSVRGERVMEVLAEYHGAMGGIISRHEGTVEHFAGDGLMVVFNDPYPCPDAELRATRMSIELRDRMAELGRSWRRRGHELGFGVGISYGYATLGQIGFEGRFHYAAIGSVVNLAARLCGEAKDGQILASRRVGLAVEGHAEVAAVGDLVLKGFRDPVPAFEVGGGVSGASGGGRR